MSAKHTPGPWKAREMARHGEIHGYFVAAPDVNGFAYDAEILGEDEYRDPETGMARWKADADLIAAAPELLAALKLALPQLKYNARLLRDMQAHAGVVVDAFAAVDAVETAIAKSEGQS